MTYASLSDLIDRYGAELILQHADRDHDGTADPAVVARALADADAEIDGWLASRYPVPVDPPSPRLKALATEIAWYRYTRTAPTTNRRPASPTSTPSPICAGFRTAPPICPAPPAPSPRSRRRRAPAWPGRSAPSAAPACGACDDRRPHHHRDRGRRAGRPVRPPARRRCRPRRGDGGHRRRPGGDHAPPVGAAPDRAASPGHVRPCQKRRRQDAIDSGQLLASIVSRSSATEAEAGTDQDMRRSTSLAAPSTGPPAPSPRTAGSPARWTASGIGAWSRRARPTTPRITRSPATRRSIRRAPSSASMTPASGGSSASSNAI